MTEEKPLTKEDVLKLIEEHGGPEGLDLSGAVFEPRIDLSKMNLCGIILDNAKLWGASLKLSNLQEKASLQRADLSGAVLEEASLLYANLKEANLGKAKLRGANLYNAQLQNANLWAAELTYTVLENADLEGATLCGAELGNTYISGANLSKAYLNGADLSQVSDLSGIKWGKKYIIGEENKGDFVKASRVYRKLKQWHSEAGMYDIAGEFYFREMTVRRKELQLWPDLVPWAKYKIAAILCGYGEKPLRVVISAAVVVLGLAGIYTASALSFLDSLYHSAVSFTALGYGLGISTTEGWVKGLGAFESFIGVFMMALFLITFVRKMTR